MNESWIALLTFVSASLLTISLGTLLYDWLFRYRFAVRDRLKTLSDQDNGNTSVSVFKDFKRLHFHELVEHQTWGEWLQNHIDRAGIQCSNRAFAMYCLGSGLLTSSAGILWAWWLVGILGIAGTMLPFVVLILRKRIRHRRISRQLPEAFSMISRAVKAGQTVPSALQIIADDFDPPISAEFARCYEQQNLGVSRELALRQLANRTGIMELQIFVVALLVQAKSGGDLVELLDNLSAMIRKRVKLKDRVRALTGEGRMQALVLMILPVAGLLGIIVTTPEYARTLLDRPWLLAGTAAVQAVGAFWVRRIVNFQY
jgi:tight adherence protein B